MISEEKVDELTEQLEDMDLERAMNYSLADAIREGSTVTEQAIGDWGNGETACALSAAAIAAKARHLID
jgi:hypothetical protein